MPTPVMIKCEHLTGIIANAGDETGKYLRSYDPDARGGFGEASWTGAVEHAMRFENFSAAFELWRAQSKVKPLRDDGQPNRPLTAYSVSFPEVPQ